MNTTRESLLLALNSVDPAARNFAWAEFLNTYSGLVRFVVDRYLGRPRGQQAWEHDNHPFASDVCQDVIVALLQKVRGFKRDPGRKGAFRRFLCDIARNKTVDQLRKRRHELFSDPQQFPLMAADNDIELLTEEEHKAYWVNKIRAKLRAEYPEDFDVLWEVLAGQLTRREAAARLGVESRALNLIIHRLTHRYQEHYENHRELLE